MRELSPQVEQALRVKAKEIRINHALIEMAAHEPEDYIEAVRDLTGYSPDELADIVGDDSIRPKRGAA